MKRNHKNRRALDGAKQFNTLVGEKTKLMGQLESDDNCIFYGSIIGDCNLDADLILGESARWQGSITAQNIIISGIVEGNTIAHVKLELSSTARVKGSIKSPAIAIAEGAVHEGEIQMPKQADIVRYEEKRNKE